MDAENIPVLPEWEEQIKQLQAIKLESDGAVEAAPGEAAPGETASGETAGER